MHPACMRPAHCGSVCRTCSTANPSPNSKPHTHSCTCTARLHTHLVRPSGLFCGVPKYTLRDIDKDRVRCLCAALLAQVRGQQQQQQLGRQSHSVQGFQVDKSSGQVKPRNAARLVSHCQNGLACRLHTRVRIDAPLMHCTRAVTSTPKCHHRLFHITLSHHMRGYMCL
jgi:hypothetical protein